MSKREAKTLARKSITRVVETMARRGGFITRKRTGMDKYLGRFEVLQSVDLYTLAVASKVLGSKWQDHESAKALGLAASSLARWKTAGHVATVLQGNQGEDGTYPEGMPEKDRLPNLLGRLPDASPNHLASMYRIISREIGKDGYGAACALLRSTWTELVEGSDEYLVQDEHEDGTPEDQIPMILVRDIPDLQECIDAAERVAPSNRSGGSSSDDEKDDDEKDDGSGSENASSDHLAVADPAKVESALANWAPQAASLAETFSVSPETVRGIGLAVLRFAGEHGSEVMQVVLSGTAPAAPETTETEPETAPVK